MICVWGWILGNEGLISQALKLEKMVVVSGVSQRPLTESGTGWERERNCSDKSLKHRNLGVSKRFFWTKNVCNLWRKFSCNTQLNRVSHHHRMFLRIQEDQEKQWKSPEGKGQWEVIKCCGKDASFPSRSASITNCQELGKCISKKSVSSCLIHLIISLNVFYCSLLETGCCSEGFWNRELLTSEATASFLVKSYL